MGNAFEYMTWKSVPLHVMNVPLTQLGYMRIVLKPAVCCVINGQRVLMNKVIKLRNIRPSVRFTAFAKFVFEPITLFHWPDKFTEKTYYNFELMSTLQFVPWRTYHIYFCLYFNWISVWTPNAEELPKTKTPPDIFRTRNSSSPRSSGAISIPYIKVLSAAGLYTPFRSQSRV